MTELQEAAKAMCARWDSPDWSDGTHTSEYINRLRKALAEEGSQQQRIDELEAHHGWMMDKWIPESLQKHIAAHKEVTCSDSRANKFRMFTISWEETDD